MSDAFISDWLYDFQDNKEGILCNIETYSERHVSRVRFKKTIKMDKHTDRSTDERIAEMTVGTSHT